MFSGGKDSSYALWWAMKRYEVSDLVTVHAAPESYMYHTAAIELAGLAAESIGIPQVVVETRARKEEELLPLRDALAQLDVDGLVSGAVASRYQKSRLDAICNELGIESIAPLWGRDPVELVLEMIGEGFQIMIVGVYAGGLGEEWLGCILDENVFRELVSLSRRYGFSPVGEGGEFETMVLDGPHMKWPIMVEYEREWRRDHGQIRISRAWLDGAHALEG